jgi:hypothetical protein
MAIAAIPLFEKNLDGKRKIGTFWANAGALGGVRRAAC